jgi:hypothetical protein
MIVEKYCAVPEHGGQAKDLPLNSTPHPACLDRSTLFWY